MSFNYGVGLMTGIVQPIGLGAATLMGFGYAPPLPLMPFHLWILVKESDNWSPEQDLQ
jgi:hypothetical protein